ncbi:hypothetical protein BDQ17DRAFT_1354503 [Cyathus striatus]|nr:hypothetical protein BDQ17DRAFT_1354503 [Cyathus striatus]
MSHAARCLRSLDTAGKLVRRVPATKRHMQAQAQLKARPVQHSASVPSSSFDPSTEVETHSESDLQPESTTFQRTTSRSAGAMAWHLNQVFSPLEFSEELAHRVLTHSSHPEAREGHNGQLSFVALLFFLLTISTSSHFRASYNTHPRNLPTSLPQLFPSLHRGHDLEHIIAQTMSSPVLGQHIGSNWGLGQVIKWSPAVPKGMQGKKKELVGAGLWKVQGEAVSAVLGGVYWQYGASTAHKLFHTRMLPHLLLEGSRNSPGLPSEFHEDARNVCARMGGLNVRLLSREKKRELIQKEMEKTKIVEGEIA